MTNPALPPRQSQALFFDKFAITERLLERCLARPQRRRRLRRPLLRVVTATALGVDEQIVKSASQAPARLRHSRPQRRTHGLRYTDNLNPERLLHAPERRPHRLRPATQTGKALVEAPPPTYPFPRRIRPNISRPGRPPRTDSQSRPRRPCFDPRMSRSGPAILRSCGRILIAASDGAFASDTQALCRLNVFVSAKQDAITTKGSAAAAAAPAWTCSSIPRALKNLAREAARGAILQLGAVAAPPEKCKWSLARLARNLLP